MTIKQAPFTRYNEEKKADSFTVWLNKDEREILETCKVILEQSKDSTVIKQLAWIGAKTIGSPQTSELLGIIFKNKRKNQRLGVVDFD